MIRALLAMAAALAACGDNLALPSPGDAARIDAPADAPVDAPVDATLPTMVRVFGHVEGGGLGQANVAISTLEAPIQHTATDPTGDFYFDMPEGSRLIMNVEAPPGSWYRSMIRGVIAYDHLRPRVFYLLTEDEIAATTAALDVTFDPSTAILEVDFRNAELGGYGVTLTTPGGDVVAPAFGVVFDGDDQPQLGELTLVGGNGSTLLLAGLPPGPVHFAPIVPAGATLPCQPRDADPLPLVAGAVTWFDYECGNGTD